MASVRRDKYFIGDNIEITGKGWGVLGYIGKLESDSNGSIWYGVDLNDPISNGHDGNGYFPAVPKHGYFALKNEIVGYSAAAVKFALNCSHHISDFIHHFYNFTQCSFCLICFFSSQNCVLFF